MQVDCDQKQKTVSDKRAISINQFYACKFKIMEFTDKWERSFGKPELSGTWLIHGAQKNGKSDLIVQIAKYLTNFGKVAFNSLEEGKSESLRKAFKRSRMHEVKNRILLLDKEPIDELKIRLRKRKSADIIIIDSLQYTGMKYAEYRQLKDEFSRNKLFIFTSHAEGKEPAGRVAKSVRYDCNITLYVEGFKAFPNSRYGGNEPFIIWSEGAAKYWSR